MLPIGALAWLGVRVIQQDHDLERQRGKEHLEFATGQLALAIERRLEEIEEPLAQGHGIRLTVSGLDAPRGSALLYQPDLPQPEEPYVFAEAETLEYERQDLAAAVREFRRLAESGDPAIRAAAHRWRGSPQTRSCGEISSLWQFQPASGRSADRLGIG
jgi:hypothetical protein